MRDRNCRMGRLSNIRDTIIHYVFKLSPTGGSFLFLNRMKGINTPGQALDLGGVASFSAPRDGVSYLAFPALSRERNLPADSFPLALVGNEDFVDIVLIHQYNSTSSEEMGGNGQD